MSLSNGQSLDTGCRCRNLQSKKLATNLVLSLKLVAKEEGEYMSRYGEDGSSGYAKEELYDEIDSFLRNHTIAELLEVLTDVVKDREP